MQKFRIEILTNNYTIIPTAADALKEAENIAVAALHDNANGVRIYRAKDKKMIKEYYFANGIANEIHVHSILPFA